MRAKTILAAAALFLVAGCAQVDPGFGEGVRHHMALQIIDPHPKQQTDLVEGGTGDRSAAAVQRYREGKVKEPRAITTANTGVTGGAGLGR